MGIYRHIADIMHKEPGSHTVIEIGTNTGVDTNKIYKLSRPCRYYAFEPNPTSALQFMKQRIAQYVQFNQCAVGNVDGTVEFNQCDCIHPVNRNRFTGASSILEPTDTLLTKHPWIIMKDTIDVPICKLDTFVKERNVPMPITFIWCDAQGAEGQIIQGATETLKRTKYFFFEYFTQEMYKGCMLLDELLELLPGWTIVERYTLDILLKNTRVDYDNYLQR